MEMPEDPPKATREGISTIAQISAFFGALFFSALLILIQQKNEYDNPLFASFPITYLQIIAIPLTISTILFIFSALLYALAGAEISDQDFHEDSAMVFHIFEYAIFSFFIAFLFVLFFMDFLVGIIGLIFIAGILYSLHKKMIRNIKQKQIG